jgi:8-oxo-dGTP diphosphatase
MEIATEEILTECYRKTGVAAMVSRGNLILMGKRINPRHGDGTWCFPGGEREAGETLRACAIRGIAEETGLKENVNFRLLSDSPVAMTNDDFDDKQRWRTFYMRAEMIIGEPKVTEPEKFYGFKWVKWGEMPTPLFLPVKNLILRGYNPFA